MELDSIYFPTVTYYMDNKDCAKMHYTIELFNNGCMHYTTLLITLAKCCNVSVETIKEIVDKYINSL